MIDAHSQSANYVVQTALDYSDPAQRAQLVDNIRPILRKRRFSVSRYSRLAY